MDHQGILVEFLKAMLSYAEMFILPGLAVGSLQELA